MSNLFMIEREATVGEVYTDLSPTPSPHPDAVLHTRNDGSKYWGIWIEEMHLTYWVLKNGGEARLIVDPYFPNRRIVLP